MEEDMEQSPAEEQADLGQQEPTGGVITIVLTADNHLGYAVPGQQPRKREEGRQRLRHALQQATDFAIGQGVDLFVQAGDLFDTTNPDEEDRSFIAARLAQLRQAGIRTFALGGIHDTPVEMHTPPGMDGAMGHPLAPQVSYARLGALHYFQPGGGDLQSASASTQGRAEGQSQSPMQPLMVDVRGMMLAICGLGVLADQEGDPLAHLRIESDIERADIALLLLHAPIEGLAAGSSSQRFNVRAQVSRASIANQPSFRFILAGYHHGYQHVHIGQCDVVVAGATQHMDFDDPDDDPGFVFLGLAADGMRWCRHIAVDALQLHRLVIHTTELWPEDGDLAGHSATESILERIRPLCKEDSMLQLRLEGELTRSHYHQLDLNQVRHYAEEHCLAMAIDTRGLSFLPVGLPVPQIGFHEGSPLLLAGAEVASTGVGERFSPREELVAVADEWIAAAGDEQERRALQTTKEELLAALDQVQKGFV